MASFLGTAFTARPGAAAGSPALTRALDSWDGLVDALPIAMYVCDLEGYVIRYNRKAAELWGRAPVPGEERWCGSLRLFQTDGTPLAHADCPMAAVLQGGPPVRNGEVVIERPDGSRITALVSIEPVHDDENDGAVAGAINCFQDITARKRAEARLATSERRYRDLLDALPAAVYTTDADGRITFFNEAAANMAGRRPVLGVDEWCVTWRLYHPDGRPMAHDECPMAIALKENRAVRGAEAVAERPDGTRVPFIPYPTPLRDEDGRPIGAVNMLVDVSERKASEANQRLLLDELNHRVKNNMQMLHALLTSACRSATSIEARTALNDAARRVAAMAAAQRALYAGGPERYAAAEFLEAVCASAQQGLSATVRIEIEAADTDLSNETALPLSLTLNELLTNAVKHGNKSPDAGTVRVGLTEDSGGFALWVSDEGPGFDPDVQSQTCRRSSGLGLIQGLARQLGGSLVVERRHPGALCTVRFPDSRSTSR